MTVYKSPYGLRDRAPHVNGVNGGINQIKREETLLCKLFYFGESRGKRKVEDRSRSMLQTKETSFLTHMLTLDFAQ